MYEVRGVKVEVVVQLMCATSLSWPVQMAVVVPRGGSVTPEMYSFLSRFYANSAKKSVESGFL
jgi:hypothetical protein